MVTLINFQNDECKMYFIMRCAFVAEVKKYTVNLTFATR
ncbi:hypothetical protein VAEU17_4360119 [Vibrio aestuarianus]|nr:hypothetical protein VAEU17_4360119 [Vibrio aestuarianus]